MILEAICVILTAILLRKLFIKTAENRKKLQFFKEKSPNLPVLKDPNLFLGHANKVALVKRSCTMASEYMAKYGPTVGFFYGTKPCVATIDLDLVKAYLIDQPDVNDRMLSEFPIHEIEHDSLGFSNGDQWTRMRRAIAPAFSAHKIKAPNVQAEIGGLIEKFVGLIERRLDEAAAQRNDAKSIIENTDDICLRYSLGVVYTCFYKKPEMIDFMAREDKTVAWITRGFAQVRGTNLVLKVCVAMPELKPLFNWLLNFNEMGRARNKIMAYIGEQLDQYLKDVNGMRKATAAAPAADEEEASEKQRQQQPGEMAGEPVQEFIMQDGSRFKRNMIDYVNEQYRVGKLTRSEFFNNSFLLFLAGHKTSSDAVAKTLYHLACHQAVQDKLRESIMADGIESEYLSWVINESLRLFPPAPNGASRIMKRDMHTKHGMVPAGTFVITPAYTICRLPEYWGQDANEFKPERWANAKSFHPCQYLVFGGGRRSCPGKDLVIMETKALLNVLLRKYKFEQCAQTDHEQLFESPLFTFVVFDKPTLLRISRL